MTLTAVPIEIAAELSQEALDYITELLEDKKKHSLPAILQFLEEYNSDEFLAYYVDYVEQCGKTSSDVVDSFLDINHISDVFKVEQVFCGVYESEADFAEDYYNSIIDVADALVIDWEQTFNKSLSEDYDYVNGYVFQSNW